MFKSTQKIFRVKKKTLNTQLSLKTIWGFAQNKPTLVVRDIVTKYPDVDPDFVYSVLLQRGVFKWLSVRRDLIKLKEKWKGEVRDLNHKKTQKEKGYHKALIQCRAEVRKLCHSERWAAPDFDRKARRFLKTLTKQKAA